MRYHLLPALFLILVLAAAPGCPRNRDTKSVDTSSASEDGADSGTKAPPTPVEDKVFAPADMERLTADTVQPLVKKGEALLVCAYGSDERCEKIRLEGSLYYSTFLKKVADLPKDKLLVFY